MNHSIFTITTLALLISSCTTYRVEKSDHRSSPLPVLSISPEISIKPTGEINSIILELYRVRLVSAGFQVNYRGKTLYIDPVMVEEDPPAADFILITHDHPDHLRLSDIEKLNQENTRIIAPHSIVDQIQSHNEQYRIKAIQPGQTMTWGEISVTGVSSYNKADGLFSFAVHPKSTGYTGYLIDLGGTRIFHAGDSDFVPEMRKLGKIQVAMIPIGVWITAMTPAEAAHFVNVLQPEITIPMHYNPEESNLQEFLKQIEPGKDVFVISPQVSVQWQRKRGIPE